MESYEIVWLFMLRFPEDGEELQEEFDTKEEAVAACQEYINKDSKKWYLFSNEEELVEWRSDGEYSHYKAYVKTTYLYD